MVSQDLQGALKKRVEPEADLGWDELHSVWLAAGLDPERFWHITVAEVDRELRATHERRLREHNERISLAWHIAALDRTKKLPKLESLVANNTPQRKQTPQEMASALKTIFLAFGGNPAELNPHG